MLRTFPKPEERAEAREKRALGIEDRFASSGNVRQRVLVDVCMDAPHSAGQTRKVGENAGGAVTASAIGTGMESSPRGCR